MRVTSSRRRFFLGTSAVAAAALLLPGRTRAASANEKLNLAIIGAGGRGSANLSEVAGENIVALCDVDQRRAADAFNKYPRAKKYADFRKLPTRGGRVRRTDRESGARTL